MIEVATCLGRHFSMWKTIRSAYFKSSIHAKAMIDAYAWEHERYQNFTWNMIQGRVKNFTHQAGIFTPEIICFTSKFRKHESLSSQIIISSLRIKIHVIDRLEFKLPSSRNP